MFVRKNCRPPPASNPELHSVRSRRRARPSWRPPRSCGRRWCRQRSPGRACHRPANTIFPATPQKTAAGTPRSCRLWSSSALPAGCTAWKGTWCRPPPVAWSWIGARAAAPLRRELPRLRLQRAAPPGSALAGLQVLRLARRHPVPLRPPDCLALHAAAAPAAAACARRLPANGGSTTGAVESKVHTSFRLDTFAGVICCSGENRVPPAS